MLVGFSDSTALAVPHPPRKSFLNVPLLVWKLESCAVPGAQFERLPVLMEMACDLEYR